MVEKQEITRMSTDPGCGLLKKDFIFRSLEYINLRETHMERKTRTTKFAFLKERMDKEILEAFKSL